MVAYARAEKKALDVIANRQKGEEVLTPEDSLGISLTELAREWREENDERLAEKTLDSYCARFAALDDFVKRIPARMVTRTHVHEWLRYLLRTKEYAPKTLEDGYFAAAKSIFT